jgi:hypothetical protein
MVGDAADDIAQIFDELNARVKSNATLPVNERL